MLSIKKILQITVCSGLFISFMACNSTTAISIKKQVRVPGVAEEALSYRNTNLLQADTVPVVKYSDKDPGESVRIQRSFENAPPLIPHDIEGFVPITREDNQCLGCHDPVESADAEAPAAPASHLFDLRRNKKLTTVNNANYNCTQCHVPQSNAPLLIGNDFKADYRSDKSKKSSNLLDVINEGVQGANKDKRSF